MGKHDYSNQFIYPPFYSDPSDFVTPELKAKLTHKNLHYLSVFGISYFAIKVTVLLMSCLLVCVPTVYKDTPHLIMPTIVVASFMYINLMANFYMITQERSYYKPSKTASHGLPDMTWEKCIDCNHNKPPRTHHCALCGYCILKRDHHCFFTGCCIGFYNQRYFVFYCLYASLGSAYGCSFVLNYIELAYGLHPLSWDFHHFLLPWTFIEWILGYVTFGFLYFTILALLTFMSAVGTAALMCFQLYLIGSGKTMHEFSKGNSTYRTTVRQHFLSVFGPYWYLNIFLPLPWLKNVGDGIYWGTSKYV